MEKVVSKIKSVYTLSKRKYDIDFKRNNAKCKRVSLSCRETKKNTKKKNTESSPLSAITTLIDVLGLVFKWNCGELLWRIYQLNLNLQKHFQL